MNKFLKILGLVVAVHVVVLLLMFVNPGCRSSSQRSAPIVADTVSPAATASAPTDFNASAVPAVSVNIPSSAAVRYSPTRPGTPASAALESAPPVDVTPATTYTVVSGDSLWKIARKHGTTQVDLERANRLTSSSRLSIGQKLIIPGKAMAGAPAATAVVEPAAGETYVVKGGDTLAIIARRAGSTSADLKRLNSLKSDYVQVGQELRLPVGLAPARVEKVPSAAAAPVAPVRKADGSVIHVVKPGETIGAIARKYQVKAQDLLVANNIADPRKIRAGQELVIPGAAAASIASPVISTSPAAPPAAAPAATTSAAPALAPAATPPLPAANQDLDAGLQSQGSPPPVIKVEDNGEPKAP
jgi:LysM repeat protein